jgi:hypothetical protein
MKVTRDLTAVIAALAVAAPAAATAKLTAAPARADCSGPTAASTATRKGPTTNAWEPTGLGHPVGATQT